jgi:Ca2+-binding EF-hand superfamily protein
MSISKLGKNVKYMYETLDVNNDGSLSPEEIINGLKVSFNVYFSFKESVNLCDYLDADKSGDIDFDEFSSKINYIAYNQNYANFLITKTRFISIVLEHWKIHREIINKRLMKIFEKFDDNGDGVLTYEEFTTLVNNIEPNLNQQTISSLFNEVILV